MKTTPLLYLVLAGLISTSPITLVSAAPPTMKMTADIPASITTPASVETSIGTLEFFDGVPTTQTVGALNDYIDRARAVQVFINMIPAVSSYQLRQGQRDIGAKKSNQILIWEELMDSKSLVLTGSGKRCSCTTRSSHATDTGRSMPGHSGTIRPSWFPRTCSRRPRGPGQPI